MHSEIKVYSIVVVVAWLALSATGQAMNSNWTSSLAEAQLVDGKVLLFDLKDSPDYWILRVSGPEGFNQEQVFFPGEPVHILSEDERGRLPDGDYLYELQAISFPLTTAAQDPLAAQERMLQEGRFRIIAGNFQVELLPDSNWQMAAGSGFTGLEFKDVSTGNGVIRLSDGAPQNSMVIDPAGDLGLGTSAPLAAVHLRRLDGTAEVVVEDAAPTAAVRTMFRLDNNGAPRFAFTNTNSGIEWSFQQSGPGNFLISKEGTGGPEMQVYQTGMVRMGPGGTNNFTLYPNGNLAIAGSLTANGSVFPDYVFEPDYELMPLPDLRSYIQAEKRLPDIPSAAEVKKQGGHNMTELQLKMLEKIEELTLYTLQQDQLLLQKDQQIADLRTRLTAIEKTLENIR